MELVAEHRRQNDRIFKDVIYHGTAEQINILRMNRFMLPTLENYDNIPEANLACLSENYCLPMPELVPELDVETWYLAREWFLTMKSEHSLTFREAYAWVNWAYYLSFYTLLFDKDAEIGVG